MAKINLTAAMRSNLASLQNTQKLMDTTQNRLSTGLKVNSALDNPIAYFTASGLNNRAGDLSSLLDSMGQAVQTIKAADEGIKSLTTFAQQAKAMAQQARDTSDLDERESAAKRFNAILTEMDNLTKDSGYKGVNLLNSQDLTVVFNEKSGANKHTYLIEGKDALTTGDLDIPAVTHGGAVGDWNEADIDAGNVTIDAAIAKVEAAITRLRGYASDLGNSYNIVQTREDFTDSVVNVLTEGADKLTLADMNEESANMLALQTRQQLGINSLSLASQAAQSVLKLFS